MINIVGNKAYWVINKAVAYKIGFDEALVLSEFFDRGEGGEAFLFLSKDIEKATLLTYTKQKRCINHLVALGLVKAERKGTPAKLYFTIIEEGMDKLFGITSVMTEEKVKIKFNPKPYIDKFESTDDVDEAIQSIYKMYPTKCHSGRSTGKSEANKKKINRLLKMYTVAHIVEAIKYYLNNAKATTSYLSNFATFLNNLPDIDELTSDDRHVGFSEEKKIEINKRIKFLSANYMFNEPDLKSNKIARELQELGYDNDDFLKRFLI